MTDPAPDLRERLVTALSKAGAFCGECDFEPGDVGCPDCQRAHGWYADAVLGIVQPELAERDQLRADLARVDEEIAEFQAAAEDDPTTPPACLHMIELLLLARAPKET
jgi:hypothetical protein